MRKFWMLLFVAVMLCTVLAVPAMAADHTCGSGHCCDCTDLSHDGWTPISEVTFVVHTNASYYKFPASGKYYIDDAACVDGVFTKSLVFLQAENLDITICLNGKSWAGNGVRPVLAQGGTLKIVDCSAQTNGVGSGKILGYDHARTTSENGAAMRLFGSVVASVYNCTVDGGVAKQGGTVAIESSGAVRFENCVINGGEATTYGGAIWAAGKNITLYKVSVNGGTAPRGGAAFINLAENKSTFVMQYTTVKDGVAVRTNDGAATNATGRGSNLYVNKGTITIKDSSTVQGGTVSFVNEITDGKTYDDNSKTNNNRYGGSAIYAAGGTINIANSRINGYTDAKLWRESGTIYNAGGTINLVSGVNVTASSVNTCGAVVYNQSGTVTVKGTSTLNASNLESIAFGGAVVNFGTFNLEGSGKIIGCKAIYTNGGGAVNQRGGTFNLKAGTISGGSAIRNGSGNAYGGNVSVEAGDFVMTGGTISGGIIGGTNALGGGNLSVTGGTFTMTAGTITGGQTTGSMAQGGGLYVGGGTVTIGGSAKITGNSNGNVYLTEGNTLTISAETPLTADAAFGITCASPAAGLAVSTALSTDNYKGIYEESGTYYIHKNATTSCLELVSKDATAGAACNGVLYDTLAEGLALVSENDLLKLFESTESITIPVGIYLDLNGKTVTGLTVTNDAVIKMFDSSAVNYVAGSGKVTLAGGSIANFARDFLTGSVIDRNYRFITVVDAEGNYTAHRIYLAVDSTSLYPAKTGIKYNVVLRCDEVIADMLNKNGDYALKLTYTDFDTTNDVALETTASKSLNFRANGFTVKAFDAETLEDNDAKAGLLNMISEDYTDELNNHMAHMNLVGKAYIKVVDSAGSFVVSSAEVSHSLKSLAEKADTIYDDLTAGQQGLMKTMYQSWTDYLTAWGWNLPKVVAALTPESGNEG